MDSGHHHIEKFKYRYIVLYDKELKSIVDMFSYDDSHINDYDFAIICNSFETLDKEQTSKPKFSEKVILILNKILKFFALVDVYSDTKYIILKLDSSSNFSLGELEEIIKNMNDDTFKKSIVTFEDT